MPAVKVIMRPIIQTKILLDILAIARAKALMYFVTETPATLKIKMPNIEIMASTIKVGFWDSSSIYTVNPYTYDPPSLLYTQALGPNEHGT